MVETSHYAVLRVPVNATPDQIRAAYKRRAIETHPDKTNDDGEAFKAVQAAYTILQDASRRAWYDREQVTPPRPPFAAARRPPTEQDYDEMKRRAAEVAAGLDRAAARRSAEAQRAAAWKAHLAREAREREEAVRRAEAKMYAEERERRNSATRPPPPPPPPPPAAAPSAAAPPHWFYRDRATGRRCSSGVKVDGNIGGSVPSTPAAPPATPPRRPAPPRHPATPPAHWPVNTEFPSPPRDGLPRCYFVTETDGGECYHLSPTCGGLRQAGVMRTGDVGSRRLCELCAKVAAVPVVRATSATGLEPRRWSKPGAPIYYTTRTGRKYHADRNCSGLRSATTLFEARTRPSGLAPCHLCCGTVDAGVRVLSP